MKIVVAAALLGALRCAVYDESMFNPDGGGANTTASGGTGGGSGGSTSIGGSGGAGLGGSGGSAGTGGTAGKSGADGGAGKDGSSGSGGAGGSGGRGGAGGSSITGGSGGTTAGASGAAGVGGVSGSGGASGGAAGSAGSGGTTGGASGTGGTAAGGAAGSGGTGATGGAAGTGGMGGTSGAAGTGGGKGGTGGAVDAGPDGGPGPTGGGDTLIIADHSEKCMTVLDNGTGDGTNIVQQPCTGSSGQVYRFQNQGGGVYKILHVASGRYVSANGPATNSYVIEIRNSSTSALQQWSPMLDTGVYYSLINQTAGYCLDVYSQQTADGAEYETYQCNGGANQAFRWASP